MAHAETISLARILKVVVDINHGLGHDTRCSMLVFVTELCNLFVSNIPDINPVKF